MGYTWDKTIYALFDNPTLKKELNKWALLNNIKIYYGNPDSDDIITLPYFAAIIDRNLLSKEIYELYFNVISEVNNPEADIKLQKEFGLDNHELSEYGYRDDHLCIIVDNIKDMPYPKLDLIMQVGFDYQEAIPWIINNLEYRKSKAK